MRPDGKLVVLVGFLASLAAIVGFGLTFYGETQIEAARVFYANPTEENAMAIIQRSANCAREASQETNQAIRNGVPLQEAYDRSQRAAERCAGQATQTDPRRYFVRSRFLNGGGRDMRNVAVHWAARAENGEIVTGLWRQPLVVAGDSFGSEESQIPFRPVRTAICIEYGSGPGRRSWIAYAGTPLNLVQANMGIGETGSQRSFDGGDSYFGASACPRVIRSGVQTG